MAYDDYSIKCQTCGRLRGEHFSYGDNSTLIFCKYKDLKRYTDTGQIGGQRFTIASQNGSQKAFTEGHRPEITEGARVIMTTGDPWAKEGQVGTVKNRDGDSSVRVYWDKGPCFCLSIKKLSLLSDSKDPNILFLARKHNHE